MGALTKLSLEHRRQPVQGLEEYVRERYGQTMANDPMKPLPIWRDEMTIDPKAKVRL